MSGNNNGGYFHENELSSLIQMNDQNQILFGSGTQVLHVVDEMPDDTLAEELGQEGQVLIIQEEANSEPSEIAVWNNEKGEYELLSSDFHDFAHQILDILEHDTDQQQHGQSENQTVTRIDNTEQAFRQQQHEDQGGQQDHHDEDEKMDEGNSCEPMDIGEQAQGESKTDRQRQTNEKQGSSMLELETATGRIIQLPGEDDHVDTGHDEYTNESPSEEEEEENTELPFACTLCKKRFSRKLHLNNHMERHHGIKFVFTEKGRKVKLVRIPEGFKVVEGEKLDPCVEKLINTIDKDKLHSIIGVEEIEPDETDGGQQISASGNKDEDPADHLAELLNGKKEGQFGCGFLFRRINYTAYRVAMEKGEAPFAAFYPHDRDSVYLFRVVQAGEKHLLLPATKKDVRNAMGAKKDGGNYVIPLVAALRVTEDSGIMKMTLGPLPDEKPTKVDIMAFDDFVAYARKCQGKTVKSLADSTNISPSPNKAPIVVDAAPKFRRKFQRRTTRACQKDQNPASSSFHSQISSELCTGNNLDTPVSRAKKEMKNREPVVDDAKLDKLRRNLKKEFDEEAENNDSDDEEKDASYYPNDRRPPKKRGRGRPPGAKNRPKLF